MKPLTRLLPLLLLAALFGACAKPSPPHPKTAADYLQEGERNLDKGRYDEAIAAWEKARDSYYSPELNVLAEMKIAETYFLDKRYVEAATAYEDFLKQHPENERTEEALYGLGMSYYRQLLSPDRDQTATRNALVTFETLAKRYPQSSHLAEVEGLVARCRDRLAQHELYVGRFYLRTDHPEAAISRFQSLLTDYPRFSNRDAAWFYLGRAYLQAGNHDQAAAAFKSLSQEFPGSEYLPKAQKYLARGF